MGTEVEVPGGLGGRREAKSGSEEWLPADGVTARETTFGLKSGTALAAYHAQAIEQTQAFGEYYTEQVEWLYKACVQAVEKGYYEALVCHKPGFTCRIENISDSRLGLEVGQRVRLVRVDRAWRGLTGTVSGRDKHFVLVDLDEDFIDPYGGQHRLSTNWYPDSLELLDTQNTSSVTKPEPPCPFCELSWVKAAPEHVSSPVLATVKGPAGMFGYTPDIQVKQYACKCWRCSRTWTHTENQ